MINKKNDKSSGSCRQQQHQDRNLFQTDLGQTVVEIIIAVSIFVIIAGSSVVSILGALRTSRLAEEETQAVFLSVEGIEAVESLRNKAWNNLEEGTHGLILNSGNWEFLGTQDATGKFTREVEIQALSRDAQGNLVLTEGTLDRDVVRVLSTVSWNFTPSKTNSVTTEKYFTNWKQSVNTTQINTCHIYCVDVGNNLGTCRRNPNFCTNNNEVYESDGDQYCTQIPNDDTCCCLP